MSARHVSRRAASARPTDTAGIRMKRAVAAAALGLAVVLMLLMVAAAAINAHILKKNTKGGQ